MRDYEHFTIDREPFKLHEKNGFWYNVRFKNNIRKNGDGYVLYGPLLISSMMSPREELLRKGVRNSDMVACIGGFYPYSFHSMENVTRDNTKLGAGKELLFRMLEDMRNKKCKAVNVFTSDDAGKFFMKHGFAHCEETEYYMTF